MVAWDSWGCIAAESDSGAAGMGSRASLAALTPRPPTHPPPAHLVPGADTAAESLAAGSLVGAAAVPLDGSAALSPVVTWSTWQTDGLRSQATSWVNASVRDCDWPDAEEGLGAAEAPVPDAAMPDAAEMRVAAEAPVPDAAETLGAAQASDEPSHACPPDYSSFPAWKTQLGEYWSKYEESDAGSSSAWHTRPPSACQTRASSPARPSLDEELRAAVSAVLYQAPRVMVAPPAPA